MKRPVLLVAAIAVACVLASASTLAQQHGQTPAKHAVQKQSAGVRKIVHQQVATKIKIAPVDEYFGRLKLSILGISNTIKDDSIKYERQPETYPRLTSGIHFAEDAIRDWERKYPKDPWIAKTLFQLERFYQQVATQEGRARAKATMTWLARDFPTTWYGKTGKRELAEGKVGAPPIAIPVTAAAPPTAIDIIKPALDDQSAASPPGQEQ